MLTDEQKARLNPEQLAIAEKWDRETLEMDKVFEKLQRALRENNNDLFQEALADSAANVKDRCEHDRSIWSSCAGCDEIERLLWPEFYDENGDRMEDEEIEKIVMARNAKEV
jgi:hypothetical protein